MYIGHEGDNPPPIEYDYDFNYESHYLIIPENTDLVDELIDKICLEFKFIKDNIYTIKINEKYLKDTTKAYLIKKE